MKHQERIQEMEERRQRLQDARGEILEKFISKKEQRVRCLVELMDIEDELEELSRRQGE